MRKSRRLNLVKLVAYPSAPAVFGLVAALACGSQSLQGAVTEAWVQRYNGPSNAGDFGMSVAVDSGGNVAVTGRSLSTNGNPDYYTAKYAAADGALLWEKRYSGPGNGRDDAFAIAVDGSGNVVVTGSSDANGCYGCNEDYYTAKYAAADGTLLWERRYNGTGNGEDIPRAIAVDGSGNVVVTGFSSNGTDDDYYTAKYAVGNGALLWEQRYNGPANGRDQAYGVAVDASGNVVVTGASHNGTDLDFYTVKYAAADGALLWERRYDGPGNAHDSPEAVAVDAGGNVIVTGDSFGDCYTAKYGASDGALLWEQRYNGPANSGDIGRAIAVDGSGNVVITGSSDNAPGAPGVLITSDYYTAKYAAADGVLLWEARYPGGRSGRGQAVKLDGIGNVIVAGFYYDTNANADYHIIKYAAANGTLLWEKRYKTPGSGYDRVTDLALGPDGMIVVTGGSAGSGGDDYQDITTVVYRETPKLTSLARSGNDFQFTAEDVNSASYSVLASTNLLDWFVLGTATMIAPGQFRFTDANADQFSARFYRVKVP